jgi:hypothetical protein
MAHFFLRPELHNYDAGDHEQLHNELASVGYFRVYPYENRWYDLPTGEYYKYSTNLAETERVTIEAAILRVVTNNSRKTKDYWYVLTNSASADVKLKLKETTEQSKLPPRR